MIRVLVNGAAGRMGSEVVRSVLAEDGLELCGGVDIGAAGKDLGEVIGIGHNGMTIDKTLEEAFAKGKPSRIMRQRHMPIRSSMRITSDICLTEASMWHRLSLRRCFSRMHILRKT